VGRRSGPDTRSILAETLARYYAARQHFYRLITSNELTVCLKLDAGEMLIMDNYRLLHGRTAFQLKGGVRHMRQGYLDRDSVGSRQRVLRNAVDRARAEMTF
jgi:gamma-butyrobetaine dioxygenase